MVASEAHAITLAIEGLLGVVFTVATLTDEAVDIGEVFTIRSSYPLSNTMIETAYLWHSCLSCQLESPRCDYDPPGKLTGKKVLICLSMVDSLWLTILDALSLILSRLVNFISYPCAFVDMLGF